MKQYYDIVILGAGMVGASFAAALINRASDLGISIALIEAQELAGADDYQPSFDSRATALSYGSSLIYRQLSLWRELSEYAQAIEHIHVSDKGRFGATRLHAQQEQVPALGYVIENKRLGNVLLNYLQQHPNSDKLDFICPATVKRITRADAKTHLQVQFDDTEYQLSTSLVVMADGGRSALREQLGISYTEHDYRQHALVANVALDRAHKNIAYERFTPSGPIALLPLAKQGKTHRCSLVWTIAQNDVDEINALSDKDFIGELQKRFGYRAGRITAVGERFSYPLTLQVAQEQVRSGLVVVGNAAHTLHPVAGQGFNLALRGVMSLAKTVIDNSREGKAIDDFQALSEYQKSRKADQQSTISFSDKSLQLFTASHPLLALARDIGLQGLDICPPAKTLFSRSAMGLASPMSYLD